MPSGQLIETIFVILHRFLCRMGSYKYRKDALSPIGETVYNK
jgi:hypothetical protein